MADAGDLEVTLVPASTRSTAPPAGHGAQVREPRGLQRRLPAVNTVNPLSNLGLATIDAEDVYVVFGELSADSTDAQIVEEIRMLGVNAIDAIELLQPYLVTA